MSNKKTIDWSKWSAADHTLEAQMLCIKADEAADADSAGYYLKTAHVHSMLALTASVNEINNTLSQRLPENLHD